MVVPPITTVLGQWLKYLPLVVLGSLGGVTFSVAQTPNVSNGELIRLEVPDNYVELAHTIRRALQFHPEVRARRHALDSALQERRAVWGDYLPSIDLESTLGAESQSADNRDIYGMGQAELTVTQTLYNGFRTRHDLDNRSHVGLVRYFELQDATQRVALDVIEAYEDVQRFRRLVELAQETYLLNRRVHEQIQRRVQNGTAARVELEQMDGRLALAESNLLVEAANLHDVTQRYQRLVGELPLDTLPKAVFRERLLPDSPQQLLEQAYRYNPQFLAAVSNVGVADAQYRASKASLGPDLFLRGRQSVHHNTAGFDSRVDDMGTRSAVELVLSFNLYRGGADQARLRSADARTEEARDLRLDACLNLRQEALIAHNDRQRLLNQMTYLQQHQRSADQVREAYRSQFDIGQRSLLEILDIETEYLDASRARINGEHDLNVARARTLFHMGLLLDELNIVNAVIPSLESLNLQAPSSEGIALCQSLPQTAEYTLEGLTEGLEFELPEPLMQPMTEAPAPRLPAADLVLESSTSFPLGSPELSASGREALRNFARQLSTLSSLESVTIAGHTDSSGPAALNQQLSEQRAEAARSFLVSEGVDPEVIEAVGYGSARPIADNDTEAGRAANRRIEIFVVGRD